MKYEEKDHSNRRIHLGLIARCKKGERYGLLYGFRNPPYNGREQIYENKIFYFEKDPEAEIAENILVSYLSYDFNGFAPNVDYVYPISSLVVHNDQRGIYRADSVYHDDETWRLINEGIPFFEYEPRRKYCIYYPIIKDNVCTKWKGLFGYGIYMEKEAVIYEMYKELTSIKFINWPTLEEVTNAIIKFQEQVNSINATEIIDTFQIMKICRYISRPGSDDHYFEDLYQSLPNDDKFLSHLLPTKQENVFYDSNAYRSDGYKNDVILLKKETKKARKKAKTEYSKEKHLAFLISDFFSNAVENRNRAEKLKSRINKEFDVDNASKITSKFKGIITDNFVTLITKYNKSTETKNESIVDYDNIKTAEDLAALIDIPIIDEEEVNEI